MSSENLHSLSELGAQVDDYVLLPTEGNTAAFINTNILRVLSDQNTDFGMGICFYDKGDEIISIRPALNMPKDFKNFVGVISENMALELLQAVAPPFLRRAI